MSSRFIMPFADVGSGIKPSSGAKLFFFELDGVTPKNTFSDQLSTPTANTNPVISDSNGVFGDIYIDGSYKVDLKNKNNSQIFGGAIVADPTSGLINDLSQAYEFDIRDDMETSTIVFPVNKKLVTKGFYVVGDGGGAEYINKAGSSPESVGSPDLDGAFYADLQGKSDWMMPEVFGSDGTAAIDSVVLPTYMKEIRSQKWKSGKTYKLDTALAAGGADAFRVFSDTTMDGYGVIIDIVSTGFHNGFIMMPDDGALFRIVIGGFRFENSALNSDATAIFSKGFLNYVTIADCVAISMGQYGFGLGGADSGYTELTIKNNKFLDTNSMTGNNLSLAVELIPTLASHGLVMHGNTLTQTGDGGVFKIHTCTDSDIYANTFVRTGNSNGSQSQCVMLGGQAGGKETHHTRFHHNRVEDSNTLFGAMFIGNTSDNTYLDHVTVTGAGAILWVGGSLSDSEITNCTIPSIQSLNPVNVLANVEFKDNKVETFDFQSPSSGNAPSVLDNVRFIENTINKSFRIDATTSSDDVLISTNDFVNVVALSLFYADNIRFIENTISLSDAWVAGSQFANVIGDNYRQFNNVWDLKGLAGQTVWLTSTATNDAQIVGETVEDAVTRVVLDNGTGTEQFHNKLKLAGGGGWTLV